MKTIFYLAVMLGAWCGAALSLPAQTAVPPPTPDYQPLSDQQLDQLLGPIALYPDPLIAQILPASTLPTQIVLADRYVQGGGDPNQIEQQPWDASVQALAHYPTVLKWLDDNLNWTTELGQAFLNQQADVMNSIQRLRASAQTLGNLSSTAQQQVVDDGGNIEIVPANPQVIYVPVYDPGVVYYQSPFGSPFITFGVGFGIGGWLNCDFDWGHRNLIVWNRRHPRPANWWHERGNRRVAGIGHANVWRPAHRPTFVGSNRGDRGWNNNPAARQPNPVTTRPSARGIPPHNVPGGPPPVGRQNGNNFGNFHPANPNRNASSVIHLNVPVRPAAPPAQHFTPPSRPPTGSAFIGIQSSHDTRDFSNRGRQSMQTISHSAPIQHSAPAPRPAPSFNHNNGGGQNSRSGRR